MWVGDRLFKVFERKEFSFHSSLPEWKVTSQLSNICKFIQVWEKKKKSPPKRLCEMYETTNSLRLVYFQVKETKHLMATRKRAMCFCADYIKYSFSLSEEQFSVKKLF